MKMKGSRKLLSLLLVLAMVIGLVPMAVLATDKNATQTSWKMEIAYHYENNGNKAEPVGTAELVDGVKVYGIISDVDFDISDGLIILTIGEDAVIQGENNQILFDYGPLVFGTLSNGSTLIHQGQEKNTLFQLGDNTKGPQMLYTKQADTDVPPVDPQGATLTVEHTFGTSGNYTHVKSMDQTVDLPENASKESLEEEATKYAKSIEQTKGMGPNRDFYYLFKRAEATRDAKGNWTLRLHYMEVRFFISTTKIAAGNAGSAFTRAIPGTIQDVTLVPEDRSDGNRQQYPGKYNDIRENVKDYVVGFDEAALKNAYSSYNPETQHVVWYSIHEGYFVHVDGIVVDDAPIVTYHVNYPHMQDKMADPVPINEFTGERESYSVLDYDETEMPWPGPEFLGWSLTADGPVEYTPKQTANVQQSIDLYAVWKTFTVAYLPGLHGTFAEQRDARLVPGENTPNYRGDITGEEGYVFTGWAPAVSEKVTGNATYVAQWAPIAQTSYTVTYQPGAHGSFAEQTYTQLPEGAKTPAFEGQTTANGSYVFTGWAPEVAQTVTANAVYVAQWRYVGGYNPDPTPPTRPPTGGDTTTIPEDTTPLTPIPDETVDIPDEDVAMGETPELPAEDGTIIVDGEVPMGDLPLTGAQRAVNNRGILLSLLALLASLTAAGLTVALKRKGKAE